MPHLRWIGILIVLATLPRPPVGGETPAAEPLVISGTVETADTAPLAGAEVELLPVLSNYEIHRRLLEGRTLRPRVRTSALGTGRFHLAVAGQGVWKVRVSSPGFVPVEYRPVALTDSIELPPVTLPRDVSATVELRRPSGEPIAAAQVYAATSAASPARPLPRESSDNGWRPAARAGRTDEAGRLVLPRAADEWLDFTIHPPWTSRPRQVLEVEGLRYFLEPAVSEKHVVEVKNAAGEPETEVVVCLGELARPAGVTDPSGRLLVGGDFSGPVKVRLFAEDGRTRVDWLVPGAEPASFVLPDSSRLTGQVLDAERRRPVEGALVWPSHDPGRFVVTDARGDYELPGTEAGGFWIQAEARGFLSVAQKIEPSHSGAGRAPIHLLEPAASLGGNVVDPQGRSLAGVRLEAVASSRPPAFRLDRASDRTSSDEEGRFVLPNLWPRAIYQVTAKKPGFLPATLEADLSQPGVPPLHFILSPKQAAFGRVVDADERPLAGAVVRVIPAGERPPPGRPWPKHDADGPGVGRSDMGGSFEIAELPGREVTLRASKPGFAPVTVRGLEIPAGPGAVDLGTLVLERGVTIEGWVRDPEGEGLDGAAVWLAEDLGPSLREAVRKREAVPPDALTSADGRFTVEDLERGQKTEVLLYRKGSLPAALTGVRAPSGEPLEVVLHPASSVSGRVVDGHENPVAGAEISLRPRPTEVGSVEPDPLEGEDEHDTLTDAEGRFLVEGVTAGEYEIDAIAAELQPSEAVVLAVPENGDVEGLLFVLHPGAVIRGRTLYPDGEPIAGVQVMAGRPWTVSDAEGRYRLAGVAPGPGTVEGRHRRLSKVVEEIDVEEGENSLDLVFARGFPVSGQVTDESGAPVGGARLSFTGGQDFREYTNRSAADGSFNLPEVAAGVYTVRAVKRGYAATETEEGLVVGAPVEGFAVVLRPGATIAGQVVGLDFDDLARLGIRAESAGGPPIRGSVDYAGRYELRDLGSGDWAVKATLPGGRREARAWVAVRAGERVRRDLEFDRGLVLSGRVLFNGEPLSRTLVALRGHDVAVDRQVASDHDGTFVIEDLRPGRYRVDASHPRELLVHNEDVDLSSDREILIEFATVRLSGRVMARATSEPLADALVLVRKLLGPEASEQGSLYSVGTDTEGRFSFSRLVEGSYHVTVKKDGYAPSEENLEVFADLERLEYALERTEGLALSVVLASGRRPPHVSVSILDAEGGAILAESRPVDAEGLAVFPTLPPGTWELLVSAPGGAPESTVVTVPTDPVALVLADAGRLEVRVPDLLDSDGMALLSLIGPEGLPFQGFDDATGAPRKEWRLLGGTAAVEGVPPGVWTVQVVTAQGDRWLGSVTTEGSTQATVTLE